MTIIQAMLPSLLQNSTWKLQRTHQQAVAYQAFCSRKICSRPTRCVSFAFLAMLQLQVFHNIQITDNECAG